MKHVGGCACGALRFECSADPEECGYCHCSLCRRTTGAPVLAYASFAAESFNYTRGEPAIYRSSGRGHREFCKRCGTQIAYRGAEAQARVDVNVGSVDDPSPLAPQHHIWHGSRIPWFETADELERYPGGAPDFTPP